LLHRVGRRGAFLAFLAILDWAYGSSLIAAPAPNRQALNLLFPYPVWGWVWIGVGVICAAGVPVVFDRVSFAFAAMLKFCWALLFTDVWLAGHLARGWVAVIVWLAFGLTVLVVAGWPEPNGKVPKELLPKELRP
jgi:hypothetical protein